jgi:polyphosphate kinase
MSNNANPLAPRQLLNRELSWLEYNYRVLEQALSGDTPLLERVKFFCIFSSNLDGFFEVRVAGLKQQTESPDAERAPDGLTPAETLDAIHRRAQALVRRQYLCWRQDLRPQLAKNGIRFLNSDEMSASDVRWADNFYRTRVRPVLTPLGLDPAHPFPQLLNKSLNLIVHLRSGEGSDSRQHLAVVQAPRVLPRLVKLPRGNPRERHYVFLGDLIGRYLADLFPGATVLGHWQFRVTRNTELYLAHEESVILLKAVENELHNRRRGEAVRLEIQHGCPEEIRTRLLENLRLEPRDSFIIDGPVNPVRLMEITEGSHNPELRDAPFVPAVAAALRGRADIFAVIRERDVLLHHPYESFSSVLDFIGQAAEDPNVLAIKQTLFRTGGEPQIVDPLMRAVRNGKQVTVVVELKAGFEEVGNILWARKLEEAGVHVVYGLVGYAVHAKMCLVVRKDADCIRRYVHCGTGNYNPKTARTHTDLGLFTCRPEFGEDATNLFNLLTGVCHFQNAAKFLVAPFELHSRMLALIERETQHASKGLPARIIAKVNAIVDPGIIAALYRASEAGVKIDLIVRGVCCLRPRVRGMSSNITVRSLVDRFMENTRIFYFENACQPEVFAGSADWMPRNFFRRVEIVFPIDDGNLRELVRSEILESLLKDNVKARVLQANGSWLPVRSSSPAFRCQTELIAKTVAASAAAHQAQSSLEGPQFQLAQSPFGQIPQNGAPGNSKTRRSRIERVGRGR